MSPSDTAVATPGYAAVATPDTIAAALPDLGPVPPAGLHLVPPSTGLLVWGAVAAAAEEPCLVLGSQEQLVAISESAAELLGGTAPEQLVGLTLGAASVTLVDFTPDVLPLSQAELRRTPMLTALRTQSPTRGLVRVRLPDGRLQTLDVVASPLREAGRTVGSMSFLATF